MKQEKNIKSILTNSAKCFTKFIYCTIMKSANKLMNKVRNALILIFLNFPLIYMVVYSITKIKVAGEKCPYTVQCMDEYLSEEANIIGFV
jgi:hypothetical protein